MPKHHRYVTQTQEVSMQRCSSIPIYRHEVTWSSHSCLGILKCCHGWLHGAHFSMFFQGRGEKRHHISSYSYRKTELKLLWCPNSPAACHFQKGKGLTGSGFTECPVPKVLIRTGFVRENNNLGRQVVCRKHLGSSWFCFSWAHSSDPLGTTSSLTVPALPRAGTGEWNGNCQNIGSFYPTADQKTQEPFIQCAYSEQTNQRHWRCLIYSSNSFSIHQFIETKKENRELIFRKRMERKMCESKLFTKEILFSSPLYNFFKKNILLLRPRPYVGLDFILFLY